MYNRNFMMKMGWNLQKEILNNNYTINKENLSYRKFMISQEILFKIPCLINKFMINLEINKKIHIQISKYKALIKIIIKKINKFFTINKEIKFKTQQKIRNYMIRMEILQKINAKIMKNIWIK